MSGKGAAHRASQGLQSIIQTQKQGAVGGVGKFHHQRRKADDEEHVEDEGYFESTRQQNSELRMVNRIKSASGLVDFLQYCAWDVDVASGWAQSVGRKYKIPPKIMVSILSEILDRAHEFDT